jgi:hypothetical protein
MDSKGTGNSADLEFNGYAKEQDISTFENVETPDNQVVVEKDPNSLNAGLHRGLKDRRKNIYAQTKRSSMRTPNFHNANPTSIDMSMIAIGKLFFIWWIIFHQHKIINNLTERFFMSHDRWFHWHWSFLVFRRYVQ